MDEIRFLMVEKAISIIISKQGDSRSTANSMRCYDAIRNHNQNLISSRVAFTNALSAAVICSWGYDMV